MPTHTFDSDDLLKQYADGVIHLKEAIAGLSAIELDTALHDHNWTIRQIVHHVVDGDDLWKTCVKAALGSNEAFSMNWYWDISQDTWADVWKYAKRDVEPGLRLLQANREHTLQLLRLIPKALEQEVIVRWSDGEEQKGTISEVIKDQVAHVIGHIEEIHTIRSTYGF